MSKSYLLSFFASISIFLAACSPGTIPTSSSLNTSQSTSEITSEEEQPLQYEIYLLARKKIAKNEITKQ